MDEKEFEDNLHRYKRWIEAADQLVMEGKRPTNQLLLKTVESGSMSTCKEALAFWWETLDRRIRYYYQFPTLDHKAVNIAARLVREARDEAEAPWAEALGSMKETVELHKAESEKLSESLTETESALNEAKRQAKVEQDKAQEEIHAMKGVVRAHVSHISELKDEIKEKDWLARSLEIEKNNSIQERQALQSANEEKDHRISALEAEGVGLYKDLNSAKAKVAECQKEIKELHEKARLAGKLHKSAIAAIEAEKTELGQVVKGLEDKLEGTKVALRQANTESRNQEQESERLRSDISRLAKDTEKNESRYESMIRVLENELAKKQELLEEAMKHQQAMANHLSTKTEKETDGERKSEGSDEASG